MSERLGVLVRTASGPGVLHQLTGIIAKHGGDISSVEISGQRGGEASVNFEIELPEDPASLLDELLSAKPYPTGVVGLNYMRQR